MRPLVPVLMLCASLAASAAAPKSAGNPRDDGFRSDLRRLATELPRLRPEAFPAATRASWDAEVAALDRAIPSLPDGDVKAALLRLVSGVKDRYIRLRWCADRTFGLDVTPFPEGYRVLRAVDLYRRALGGRWVSVGETGAEEVARRVAALGGCDDDTCRAEWLPQCILSAEILRALKIVPADGAARFTFEDASGRFSLEVKDFGPRETNPGLWPAAAEGVTPLHMKHRDRNYWFEYLEPGRTLYVNFRRLRPDPARPFREFAAEVFRTATERPVERLVVDYRGTTGDDESLFRPLLDELEKRAALRAPGKLFAIVGRSTFPAAVANVRALQSRFGAVVAGVPTAPRPKRPPEMRALELPYSKLVVAYPARPSSESPLSRPLVPDLRVEAAFADRLSGKDSVLEAILARP